MVKADPTPEPKTDFPKMELEWKPAPASEDFSCKSYGRDIPGYGTLCFAETNRVYQCTTRGDEEILKYVQTLSTGLSDSLCGQIDSTNEKPNGLPRGTQVVEGEPDPDFGLPPLSGVPVEMKFGFP